MAQSILERFGVREVANLTLYNIQSDGTPGIPVYLFETLKMFSSESASETEYATGGYGNSRLIGWDFGRDITVTLQDALFSMKSLALVWNGGKINNISTVKKTLLVIANIAGASAVPTTWRANDGNLYPVPSNRTLTSETGSVISDPSGIALGDRFYVTFDIPVDGQEIVVGPSTFPGNFYAVGETFARNETTGRDEEFQIIIPRAKMTSDTSISLEADGSPTVIDMSLDVLRAGNGDMIKLVKYSLSGEPTTLNVVAIAGGTPGTTAVTVSPVKEVGNSYKYKTAASVTMPDAGDDLTTWTDWDGTADITADNGDDLVIAEVDGSKKMVRAGKTAAVSA